MGLNNNYGIKTVGKGLQTALNGKWPILGFDVNNLATTFRTTKVIDSKVNDFYNTGNTKPESYQGYTATNEKSGVARVLISRYKHGYSYRPLGYYTVTGSISAKCKTRIVQNVSGTGARQYVVPYDITSTPYVVTGYSSIALVPSMNEFKPIRIGLRPIPFMLSIGSINSNQIIVPAQNPGSPFYGGYAYFFGQSMEVGPNIVDPQMTAWISVEIDDEYVNIYMDYSYYDIWFRNTSYNYQYSEYDDIDCRVRMVADTSGSTYDVNVYLTPYKLEDLIQNG